MTALPTKTNIAKCIPNLLVQCAIYGAVQEFNSHILLHCPMAVDIWSHIGFESEVWVNNFPSLMDCILLVKESLDLDQLGEFVAVLREFWNTRNRFIFGDRIHDLCVSAEQAKNFVCSYHKVRNEPGQEAQTVNQSCKLPQVGWLLCRGNSGGEQP